MYHMLLPVDAQGERAEAAATALTDFPSEKSELVCTVLNVFEEFDVKDDMGGARSDDIIEEVEPPDTLGLVRDHLQDHGIETRTEFAHGSPVETILQRVDSLDIDHIVISGRKRTPTGKVIFGSVTQQVLLQSDVPVTVVIVGND